jgi:hypothetical protein
MVLTVKLYDFEVHVFCCYIALPCASLCHVCHQPLVYCYIVICRLVLEYNVEFISWLEPVFTE